MSDTVIFTVVSDIVMFTVMSDTVILTVTLAAHMSRMCYKITKVGVWLIK